VHAAIFNSLRIDQGPAAALALLSSTPRSGSMLYINGEILSSISIKTVLGLACLQQATSSFLQQLNSSSTVPDNSVPYLCLMQGEEACVDAKQLPGLIIGSQVRC
jgi:hypothetical protein